jgi:hypothetical protein
MRWGESLGIGGSLGGSSLGRRGVLQTWTPDQCTELSSSVIYFPERNNMRRMRQKIYIQKYNAIINIGGGGEDLHENFI